MATITKETARGMLIPTGKDFCKEWLKKHPEVKEYRNPMSFSRAIHQYNDEIVEQWVKADNYKRYLAAHSEEILTDIDIEDIIKGTVMWK